MIEQDDKLRSELTLIVTDLFPPVTVAFAYGSAVIPQAGSAPQGGEMLDLILVVEDAKAWHTENLRRNRAHYSHPWPALGASAIAAVQEGYGAGLWYNTLVPLPSKHMSRYKTLKYGVISAAQLIDDLTSWRCLYAAGRLQKPVLVLGVSHDGILEQRFDSGGENIYVSDVASQKKTSTQARVFSAMQENLRNALRSALLTLPARFTAVELFTRIASFSYAGDWRMVFGENPHKVANIVNAQLPRFFALYGPVLAQSFPFVSVRIHESGIDTLARIASNSALSDAEVWRLRFEQDVRLEARLVLGAGLPAHVQQCMAEGFSSKKSLVKTTSLTANCSPALYPRGLVRAHYSYNSPYHVERGSTIGAAKCHSFQKRMLFHQKRLQSNGWVSSIYFTPFTPYHSLSYSSNVLSQGSLLGSVLSSIKPSRRLRSMWTSILSKSTSLTHHSSPTIDLGAPISRLLEPVLARIVGVHARSQSIKGLVTAGPAKSWLYAATKVRKFFVAILQRR